MATPLTPERLAEVPSEHGQQCALFCWAALPTTKAICPGIELMFAIPNGESRGETPEAARRVGGRLKAEGVKAGVSDVFLPVPLRGWHGLWIEMKFGVNKPTVEQLEFHTRMAENGYKVAVCYSFEAAKQTVLDYYAGVLYS